MKAWPFQLLPRLEWNRQRPTHGQAAPSLIAAALDRSQRRPSGNWYVVGASTDIAGKPFGAKVAGAEVVCWRDGEGGLHAGPARCPHLGADLCSAPIDRGHLVCPWHGLRLTGRGRPDWPVLPVFDDGVLVWVRLDRIGGRAAHRVPRCCRPAPVGPCISAVASHVRRVRTRSTSSPTGWIRGTAPGFIPIRSPGWRC